MTEQEKELKFYHSNYGETEYHRVGGELWYSYEEREERQLERSGTHMVTRYKAQGKIPKDIIDQGTEAISEFSKLNVTEKIASERERIYEKREYLRNLKHSIELDYGGILLKGEIRSADGVDLVIDLLEPYQGVMGIHFGMYSSMSGHHIFNGENPPYFSEYAIKTGSTWLAQIYKDKKEEAEHPELVDLERKLFLERRWRKNE